MVVELLSIPNKHMEKHGILELHGSRIMNASWPHDVSKRNARLLDTKRLKNFFFTFPSALNHFLIL